MKTGEEKIQGRREGKEREGKSLKELLKKASSSSEEEGDEKKMRGRKLR